MAFADTGLATLPLEVHDIVRENRNLPTPAFMSLSGTCRTLRAQAQENILHRKFCHHIARGEEDEVVAMLQDANDAQKRQWFCKEGSFTGHSKETYINMTAYQFCRLSGDYNMLLRLEEHFLTLPNIDNPYDEAVKQLERIEARMIPSAELKAYALHPAHNEQKRKIIEARIEAKLALQNFGLNPLLNTLEVLEKMYGQSNPNYNECARFWNEDLGQLWAKVFTSTAQQVCTKAPYRNFAAEPDSSWRTLEIWDRARGRDASFYQASPASGLGVDVSINCWRGPSGVTGHRSGPAARGWAFDCGEMRQSLNNYVNARTTQFQEKLQQLRVDAEEHVTSAVSTTDTTPQGTSPML